ncbi:NIF3-like protein 1 isoform X1 [Cloeon dipterum]|uniref:NIF3-like protein 1 isoform X1 n=1 Tax=Cloeon dipterum TaxID=197152 RepID=UPI0032203063
MLRNGLLLREVVQRLEGFAPLWLAESWDNVGLLLETTRSLAERVKEVLLTNDLTEEVASEAVSRGVQLIISYHPPLFRPFKTITQDQWKSRIITLCMENNISIYSPHTCFDSLDGGVNDWLSSFFGVLKPDFLRCYCDYIFSFTDFESKRPIIPAKAPAGVETSLNLAACGAGRVLQLKSKITIEDAIQIVKSKLQLQHVHLALAKGAKKSSCVSTVALCAGSGSSVLSGVLADLLLTGEMSHHEVLDAVHNGKSVILTWHSNSERGYLRSLQDDLSKLFNTEVGFSISSTDLDPLVTV